MEGQHGWLTWRTAIISRVALGGFWHTFGRLSWLESAWPPFDLWNHLRWKSVASQLLPFWWFLGSLYSAFWLDMDEGIQCQLVCTSGLLNWLHVFLFSSGPKIIAAVGHLFWSPLITFASRSLTSRFVMSHSQAPRRSWRFAASTIAHNLAMNICVACPMSHY